MSTRWTAVRAAVVGACLVAAGCWWPGPGHDADRTGYNDLEGTLSPVNVATLTQKWSVQGPFYSDIGFARMEGPIVTADGVHAVAGCVVITVDPATGAERW